jgi:hypothetical protein
MDCAQLSWRRVEHPRWVWLFWPTIREEYSPISRMRISGDLGTAPLVFFGIGQRYPEIGAMMLRRRGPDVEALRCSFCRKSQDSVQKLISSPSDDPRRAYICDECVAVCASILQDDRDPSDAGVLKAESRESDALLDHPLTPQLLTAIERWIRQESLGADASEAFAEVRATAIRLTLAGARNNPPK